MSQAISVADITYDHIERLMHAVEGECDGLAIDAGQSMAILAHVFGPVSPPAVPGEVERENAKLVELIKTRFLGVHPDELDCYLEYDDWTRIIAALEGGDKGDAGMECQYSKDVGMPEHRCAVRYQYGRRQADLRIAAAIEACDWSGASIGNKEILKAAVHALRGGV